jgi:mono/diheme cytochrome c family protein
MKMGSGLFRLRVAAIAGLMICVYGCEEQAEPISNVPGGSQPGPGIVTPAPVAPATPGGAAPGGPVIPSGPGNIGGAVDGGQGLPAAPDAGLNPGLPQQPPVAPGSPWCNARAVLQTACQTCHGAEPSGAPMSLVTHADTQRPSALDASKTVAQAIKARIHDVARPMPPVGNDALSSQQLAALDAWLDAGAPNGTCDTPDQQAPTPAEEFKWPAECEEFYKIQAHQNGRPYTVAANVESNVEIEIPVPWAGKGAGPVQALAIKPLTNNKRVVHHWILYHGLLDFITSWSPGKQPETFPSDVGVYMPTDGSFRLNMHYNNVGNDKVEQDDSGLEVCLTRKLRPKTATTNMFGPFLFSISGEGRTVIESTCTQLGFEPVNIITSSPHMHSYGVAAKFEIIRADGTVEMLHDTPFNWEDQKIKPIEAVLNTGDQVKTTCIYENTTGRTVSFGQSSADEMCFNFARYYPMDALTCL